MYPEVERVVAHYLNANVGYSEEGAIERIRNAMKTNTAFEKVYRNELSSALGDPLFSWKQVFQKYDVFDAESEEEARSYARKILWEAVFDG